MLFVPLGTDSAGEIAGNGLDGEIEFVTFKNLGFKKIKSGNINGRNSKWLIKRKDLL